MAQEAENKTEWNAQVKGLESEIWEYREDLRAAPTGQSG
jgi:hypothetical protein